MKNSTYVFQTLHHSDSQFISSLKIWKEEEKTAKRVELNLENGLLKNLLKRGRRHKQF